MQGIDTNILVRFLIGDDELQTKKVYNIFKQAEADKKELFVPLLVILEIIWVLESVSAKAQGCDTVITFDKKASKYDLFQLAQ